MAKKNLPWDFKKVSWVDFLLLHKRIYNSNDEKKLNFQTHNGLKSPHVIAIFAILKKLSQERSCKMKHFVFKTLELLILEFQFWKIMGRGEGGKWGQVPPRPPVPLTPCSYGTKLVFKK